MAESDVIAVSRPKQLTGPKHSLIEILKSRQKLLEQIKAPWEVFWKEIITYLLPWREYFGSPEEFQSKRVGSEIFDGMPLTALRLQSDGFQGYLVSQNLKWFKLEMVRRELMKYREVKVWINDVEYGLYQEFKSSNFYDVMPMYFMDGGSIGNAFMMVEDVPKSGTINYNIRHPLEYYLIVDRFGRVVGFHRKVEMEARNAFLYFGELRLSDPVKNAAKDNPFKKFTFYHAVVPREERELGLNIQTAKPWASYWWEKDGKEILFETGYDEFPGMAWRWRKETHETYGRGPGSDALVDIAKLNVESETMLDAAELSVHPPWWIPEEMAGEARIIPKGMNYYEDAARPMQALNPRINYVVGDTEIKRTEEIIRQHFRVEFFMMLAQMQGKMTATEILERQGEKAALLGSTIGRLNSEALDPIIDRTFQIAMSAGRLPPPPDIIYELGGGRLEVDYLGPLAQAQRRLFRSQGITRALEVAGPVLQMNPSLANIVDWKFVFRELLESYGMPARAILPEEVVAAAERQQAAREAQIEQAAQIAELSKAVPNLNQPVKEGSVLQQVEEQARVAMG